MCVELMLMCLRSHEPRGETGVQVHNTHVKVGLGKNVLERLNRKEYDTTGEGGTDSVELFLERMGGS